MKENILKTLQKCDDWLQQTVDEAHAHGEVHAIPTLQLKIVGQMALLLADLPFPITSTMDVDILHNLPHFASKKLGELFLDSGLVLESDHHDKLLIRDYFQNVPEAVKKIEATKIDTTWVNA